MPNYFIQIYFGNNFFTNKYSWTHTLKPQNGKKLIRLCLLLIL